MRVGRMMVARVVRASLAHSWWSSWRCRRDKRWITEKPRVGRAVVLTPLALERPRLQVVRAMEVAVLAAQDPSPILERPHLPIPRAAVAAAEVGAAPAMFPTTGCGLVQVVAAAAAQEVGAERRIL